MRACVRACSVRAAGRPAGTGEQASPPARPPATAPDMEEQSAIEAATGYDGGRIEYIDRETWVSACGNCLRLRARNRGDEFLEVRQPAPPREGAALRTRRCKPLLSGALPAPEAEQVLGGRGGWGGAL